jgi:hypothetical protein
MNGYWLRSGPWFFTWDVDTRETRLFNVVVDPRSEQDLSRDRPNLVEVFEDRIDDWRAVYQH